MIDGGTEEILPSLRYGFGLEESTRFEVIGKLKRGASKEPKQVHNPYLSQTIWMGSNALVGSAHIHTKSMWLKTAYTSCNQL